MLVVLAALCSYLNYRYLRLPPTIGVMATVLVASLLLLAAGSTATGIRAWAAALVGQIDFNETVLHGMLAFLLFAGALQLDLGEMAREKWTIGLLAVLGTCISTFLVGISAYGIFSFIGLRPGLMPCLLFGALISPTDPIAVLAIMQKVGAPKRLEIQITGESLFNDGLGVVVFLTLLQLSKGHATLGVADVSLLLIREVGGGILLGLAAGLLTYYLLRRVDEYQVEILLTLALAMGGFALSDSLHFSAPITAVVAGLFIGNRGRALAMSVKTREHVDTFWELIDGILNALLFLLIGLEVLVMPFDMRNILAGLCMVPATLLARWLSVGAIIAPLRRPLSCDRGTVRILTWGALRGGISVAMALSLPTADAKPALVTATYVVVIFSIIAQGLTVGRFIRWILPQPKPKSAVRR
ncbi:MAG TPA: sodium:proton antiporter [Tepidisphaeraceae bacterium]|nr:sodium:proton antiporter [Tepidisphaeraceae bacterium]